MYDSAIRPDEFIEIETETVTTNFNEKSVKEKISIFYLPFY